MGYLKERYDEMTFYELSEGMDIEKIICAVEKTLNTTDVDFNTDFESIEIAFENASYYIKDDFTQYYFDVRCQELRDVSKDLIKGGFFDGASLVWWNKNIVELIHQVFDEECFVNRMVHLKRSKTSGCKARLQSVLYKFNMEQLKQYYQLISYGVERFCWFANELDWELMHVYLSSQVYDPITSEAVTNGFECNSSQPYFFNCVEKEQIAEILLTVIEYHTSIAENIAEMLYDLGYNDAFMYLNRPNPVTISN